MFGLNWLHKLWFTYFWPSLQGNGPEDLFHLTILGVVGWLASRVGKKIMAEWREHKEHMHAKLDHIIINHPDIPNHVPGVPESRQPKP